MQETDSDKLAGLGLTGPDLERARTIVAQFRERMNGLRFLGLEREPSLEPHPTEEPNS